MYGSRVPEAELLSENCRLKATEQNYDPRNVAVEKPEAEHDTFCLAKLRYDDRLRILRTGPAGTTKQ